MAGMEADPHLKPGIAQAADAPNQLDGRVTGQGRMVVIRDRGAEDSGKPVTQLLADDAAKLAYRASHRSKSRLEPQHRFLGLELSDKTCGIDDVGAQNRHKSALAVRIDSLTDGRSAF
jgi:hypothetical protein